MVRHALFQWHWWEASGWWKVPQDDAAHVKANSIDTDVVVCCYRRFGGGGGVVLQEKEKT